MNRWAKKFEEHEIWKILDDIKANITIGAEDELDADVMVEIRRLEKILQMLQELLNAQDPELTPLNLLSNISTHISANIMPYTVDFMNSKALSSISAANDQLSDQMAGFGAFSWLPSNVEGENHLAVLEKITDDFSRTILEKTTKISRSLEGIEARISEQDSSQKNLDDAINAKKQETDNLISQWQQQFSEAQERRTSEFGDFRQELDETLSGQKDSFSLFQQRMNDKHRDWTEDVETKVKSETAELVEKTQNTLNDTLNDANIKHAAILELYELTAGDSVGAGYLKNANDEMIQANKWRGISIGFICGTVLWLLIAFFSNQVIDDASNLIWSKLFLSISISGVLLWGGAYSAQQSTKHRNNEKKTRWFALEVKAIDPFIHSLSPESQDELKKQLSERLFGHSTNNIDDKSNVVDEHMLKVIMDGISKILTKK